MKRGFTLIELLAVIVILAIIALIAVPIVLNIISDAKKSSQEESVKMYASAIEEGVANYYIKHPEKTNVTIEELEKEGLINYSGGKVACGITAILNNGKIYLSDCKVDGVDINYEYADSVKNMLIDNRNKDVPTIETAPNYTFLNTGVKNHKIKDLNIVITGTEVPEGYESIDCSKNHDKSVMCYWKEYSNDPGYYEMNIAADGEIYAPYDSSYLFYRLGYEKLTSLDLKNLNTKYAVNLDSMINQAGYTSMTTISLGNNFDTSNATNMSGMFFKTGYEKMTTLNLGDKFDTSNVTDMSYMFNGAGHDKMTTLNLRDKFETSNVTNMKEMFFETGYEKMTTLNLGNKFDTSNVTNMSNMFFKTGYSSMGSLELGSKFDTSNVTNFRQMFFNTGRESMTSLNLGDKFDTSKANDMYQMFQRTGFELMTYLNLGKKFSIPDNIEITRIFCYCGKQDNTMSVIVPNADLQTRILGLETGNIPDFWNNTIVQVQNN